MRKNKSDIYFRACHQCEEFYKVKGKKSRFCLRCKLKNFLAKECKYYDEAAVKKIMAGFNKKALAI